MTLVFDNSGEVVREKREEKQRKEKEEKHADSKRKTKEILTLRKTLDTHFILQYIRFHLFSFTNISSLSYLTYSTNYIRDLEDFVCEIGRTKLFKFQRREIKMIDSQHGAL